ncbi:hypothetical protein HYC85_028759 [Camellia sinensis]|uniref:Uncharacterized protein n=1 Tax=Camellia sinensis TaxID=4442 RepID=A0A7J7FYD0_CAMSI|nr:hypothetical protein HYC85_028759 [Camellia sinensis]
MGKYRYLVETPGGLAEFRNDYQIPDDVQLVLAEKGITPWENEGFVPFTLQSIIETGLRFPVQPLICEFLRQTRLCPTQLSTNTYRIIMGIAALNHQTGLNLGLAEIFHQYSIGSKNAGWVYYLRIRRRREKIIKHTPDKDLNDDDFFWVSGNFEDFQAQIPGRPINWKMGEPDFAHLRSLYSYPNLAVLRAALRCQERSWAKLLNFEPTYRYSGRRKARVTDFLLEEAPEPDLTLPEIRLVPLTAEEEMAKKSRVRALLTETTRPEPAPPSQPQPAVVALPSHQPSSSRRTKRARTAETEQVLVDEEQAIQPSLPPSPQPESSDRTIGCWAPKLTFNDRDVLDTDSVVAEKDHLLAINLAKSVCLPKDMEHHQKQLTTELKSIRKLLCQAIQKNQITHKKVLELRKVTRQAVAEAEAKSAELVEARKELAELRGEVGRLTEMASSAEAEKQKTAIVLKDKYLRELVKLERKKDAEMKEKAKEADKQGFKRAEGAYAKQCNAAKELFFKCGWRGAVEKLGHDPQTEVFNPPAYFIPNSLMEYATAMQQQFLEGSDDEDSDEDSAPEDTAVVNADQVVRSEPMVEDLTLDQPSETVAPAETILPSENVVAPETGLRVDADAAFDAEIDELFS